VNRNHGTAMYEAEAKGLQWITKTATLRAPAPHYYGAVAGYSLLIMEYLPMKEHDAQSQAKLGTLLAQMHLTRTHVEFGFEIDNTIGTTPQLNPWTKDWVTFFVNYRLRFQLKLIQERYDDTELLELSGSFLNIWPTYFKGIHLRPSLLHGDLWSGNTAADEDGNPVVFDPACYFGHHEAELSIMEMFGGFTNEFYSAYHTLIPKEPGFDQRQLGYQLYHYLNHYNLFGSSYRSHCLAIMQQV